MTRKLSIKALIAATFALILAMALGATASLLVTDHWARAALARHEQAMAQVASQHDARADTLRELKDSLALSTNATLAMRIATFLVGLVLALAVYRRVARMVAQTADYAGRIERGDFAARFAAEAGGETAELAAALNRMVDRLRQATEREAATGSRLAFLVGTTPAVIYATKTAGDYGATWISPNVVPQLGWAAEDFTSDAGFWSNHIHPEDRVRVLAEQEKLLGTDHIEAEYRLRHADGSWRWMQDETVLVRDAAGAPLELVGSWLDITARKHLEEALARRHAILNAVAYGAERLRRRSRATSARFSVPGTTCSTWLSACSSWRKSTPAKNPWQFRTPISAPCCARPQRPMPGRRRRAASRSTSKRMAAPASIRDSCAICSTS